MARAIWTGSISFGLVNVPVKLHAAQQEQDVHFHQLQAKTGARIRNKRVSERTGKEVDYEDIVKGYELRDGEYVVVTPDDLEAVEPERTHVISIEDFVELEEIDPIYFKTTYWIAPEKNAGGQKAYALLAKAMDEAGRIAIGRFVMRTKEHLVAIRPVDGALALETMLFPDEVVAAKDVENVPTRAKVTDRERRAAKQLIDSLTVEWDPDRYHDTYREAVLDMIKRKAKGEEIVAAEMPKRAEVVDLMAALEASIEANRAGSRTSAAKRRRRKSA